MRRWGRFLRGSVIKLVPFGAFVRVAEGVVGLVHLSDLASPPVTAPDEAVQTGQEVPVIITGIDPLRRRLTLSPSPSRVGESRPWLRQGRGSRPDAENDIVQQRERSGVTMPSWPVRAGSGRPRRAFAAARV
ncbi:S1 RNA-binding domain-containing protein [Actinomadura sp. 9N407]|uniref:S1 RNA-binding domain-containing protein n=1 Tax=Actinomadura sp. 9N407 TaxID=3375154 RepID=UPI00379FFA48